MPKPKSPLPTLREKLASFDGAIGADDIARLLQTSRHTIYLWVRDNKIPYFRLNGCLKFDPCADRRLDRLHQLNPQKASTVRKSGARIRPPHQQASGKAIT
jgi:hypothetical protein